MTMNKSLIAIGAVLLSTACLAEDDILAGLFPTAATNVVSSKVYTTLPLCRRVVGSAEVRLPGGEWMAAEEGKFYPFGTSYRASASGTATIAFGPGATVTIEKGAEFGTRNQPVGEKSRTIFLVRGTVALKLPDNLVEGAFFVTAPGFSVKNPAGESVLTYEDKGDGDEAVLRCVTGSMGVEGRHFDIPSMHAANELRIRSTRDHLVTILYGTSGDYVVKLDQGQRFREEFDDEGKMKTTVEKGLREWHLTPFTKIHITRSVPAIGERMSVHTMAFDASGERKSECYFSEGRAEVNSGELVASDKVSGEELAKRAAEVTETTKAADAEETTEAAAEEKTSNEE